MRRVRRFVWRRLGSEAVDIIGGDARTYRATFRASIVTADSFLKKVLPAAFLLAVAPFSLPAQDFSCDRGDVEVRALEFVGNKTFRDAELASVIVTTPSSWGRRNFNLPFSAKRCLDQVEYGNDRLRLILYYRRRGFPNVTVDTALVPAGLGGVRVRFTIHEGTPTLLQSLTIVGLDSVDRRERIIGNLPIRVGDRFDRIKIDEILDGITRRLRNAGYPSVKATSIYSIDTTSTGLVANDSLVFQTGPLTRFGGVSIMVEPARDRERQISDRVVRRIVGIDSGAIYREQRLIDAQRSLYETDAYLFVGVNLDSASGHRIGTDSVAPLAVSLHENTMHSARLGAGYGTLDCFRATAELDNYNFLKGARRLELRSRVSKLGIGKPLGGLSQLCPQARDDQYSTRLNYYLGATLRQPVFFGVRTLPMITAYTQRVSEYNAYVRTTSIGGVASVVWRRTAKTPITFSYSMDYGRTEAQPSLFCSVFNLCTLEDRERVQTNQRLGVFSAVISHNSANHPMSPTSGSIARFEFRHASPFVLSDTALQFNTLIAEASRYFALSEAAVLALHMRAGFVFGRGFQSGTTFIPPQERMYGGGPTSVRGFRQNELGSVAYTVSAYDTVALTPSDTVFRVSDPAQLRRAVPVGGNSLLVGNVELRLRSPVLSDILQFSVFTDVGDVWNRGAASAFQNFRLKVTPGAQVAAFTPIGPVRVIVGYNPYRRPAGPVYFENSIANGGALPCVSPGNTIPVVRDSETGELRQLEGVCPSNFQPTARKSLRSRLTFNLAIGQAF
jgi:outer membrane protein assembly factor BamA